MKLKIIKYGGTEILYDALSFEFRTNPVSNQIEVKVGDDETIIIYNVCVIKSID